MLGNDAAYRHVDGERLYGPPGKAIGRKLTDGGVDRVD